MNCPINAYFSQMFYESALHLTKRLGLKGPDFAYF